MKSSKQIITFARQEYGRVGVSRIEKRSEVICLLKSVNLKTVPIWLHHTVQCTYNVAVPTQAEEIAKQVFATISEKFFATKLYVIKYNKDGIENRKTKNVNKKYLNFYDFIVNSNRVNAKDKK